MSKKSLFNNQQGKLFKPRIYRSTSKSSAYLI